MISPQLDPDAILEWLQTSCAAQGVPVVIRDHGLISQVAALLGHADTCTARPLTRKRAAGHQQPSIGLTVPCD